MPIKHVLDHFLNHVKDDPQKVYIKQGEKHITYLESLKKIVAICDFLDISGINPTDKVGIHMGMKPETILVYFAIIARGGCVVSMAPILGIYEIKHLLKNSLCKCIIICNEFAEKLLEMDSTNLNILNYDEFKNILSFKNNYIQKMQDLISNLNTTKEAVLLTTSGSTGEPKLIAHNLLGMNQWGEFIEKCQNIKKDSIILQPSPIGYASGILCTVPSATICGATVVLPTTTSGPALLETLLKEEITHYGGVASISKSILEEWKKNTYLQFPFLEEIRIGGEYLSKDFIKEIKEMFPQANITLTYASSEGFGFITHKVDSDLTHIEDGILGAPSINTNIKLIHKRQYDKDNDIGEVVGNSPLLMMGYMKNGIIVNPLDEDGYYHTGDIAKFNTKHKIYYFAAREKFMFTSYGTNIYPREIEAHLEKIDAIISAVVVPVIDPIGGSVPVAFIAVYKHINEKNILESLKGKVHARKIPKAIFFIKQFPILGNGKIDRTCFIKKTKGLSIDDVNKMNEFL